MIERAGFWRRCFAAFVDLCLTEIILQSLVAVAFALTGGHVTTGYSVYTSCQTTEVQSGHVDLPKGVVLPQGFMPNEQGLCWSGLFGATTRLVFVATRTERHGSLSTKVTQAYSVTPGGGAGIQVFDADFLLLPLFILLRWLCDRYGRGSLGRRFARIAVTDAVSAATGAALAPDLARRYARFAWPLLPGVALGALSSTWALVLGPLPPLISALGWICGPAAAMAAGLAAVSAIIRHADTFYDAPVGTVVAPRFELERCEVEPEPRREPHATPWTDAVSGVAYAIRTAPRVSLALVALMTAVFAAEWWLPFTPAGADGFVSLQTRLAYGGMDRELVVLLGQVYRLLTAIVLHANLIHLVLNALVLLCAGWLVEGVLGPLLYGGVFLIGGLAGSVSSIIFNPAQEVSVGASGAIIAVLAATLPVSACVPAGPRRAWMRAWPIVIIGPALVPGISAQTLLRSDIAAHAGGVAAGLLLGIAIALAWRGGVRRQPGRRTAWAVAGSVAAAALLPIPIFGWREPLLTTVLVPEGDVPATDAGWRDRGAELARRYPDDPRAALGLASLEIRDGDTAAGRRDLDRAIALQRRLAPSVSSAFRFAAHVQIGGAFFDRGDMAAAVSEYGRALAETPNAEVFRDRGIAEFYDHDPQEALTDLQRAVGTDPKEAYAVLWLSIVAARSGAPDPIQATAIPVRDNGWPDKVVAFYEGQVDAQSMVSWAQILDIGQNKNRVCEAKFYEGEHLLMEQQGAAARPLIELAAQTCPHDFIEYRAALEELAGAARFPSD